MKKLFFALFATLFFLILSTGVITAKGTKTPSPPTELRIEAVVTKILAQSEIIEVSGNKHPYQKLQLLGTDGKYKGKTIIIENGKLDQVGITTYHVGDKVVLSVDKDLQGKDFFTITDFVRRDPLYLLFALFIILAVLIGKKRGVTSLLGMGISFFIIFIFVLPQVLAGKDPVVVTIIASLFIIPITFYLSHGLNIKTTCGVIGTFIALLITGLLANAFVQATHLTGFASEEAGYLQTMKQGSINIQGLLLAGIIIGLLGVLNDITISQAAVVFQLKKASSSLSFKQLYSSAMDVGRDHIASMANTLILVYAGASLPLLLLFVNNPLPLTTVINYEIIAEEVVRTLIASIGLIIAVPITTFLTVFYIEITKKKET